MVRVVLGVERVEERAADEVLRPDHARRRDQKLAAEAGEAEASEGGREDEHDLEPGAKIEAIVELRDDDGVHHVGRGDGDVGHHVDQDMLLDVEGARVERECGAAEDAREDPDADGEDVGKCLAEGVCDEEDDGRREERCWIAEVEKRVEAGTHEHEAEAEEPHAEGQGGHLWVVHVAHTGANLGVRRVLFVLGLVHIGELVGHADGLGTDVESRVGGGTFERWREHRRVV